MYFVYFKGYNWIYYDSQMYTLNAYEQPYYMCIQRLLLTLNGINIKVTLSVYFEYIKVLCQTFIKYIASILQVYPNYFIILFKITTSNNNNYIILYYIIVLIIINFYLIKYLTFNFLRIKLIDNKKFIFIVLQKL